MMAENEQLLQIINGCKNGNAESYSQLVDIYSRRIYGYFYRLSGSADISDELLSELFVKIVEKIETYRGGNFNSWLFKVASNIFHDYLRDKQRQKKLIDGRGELLESQGQQGEVPKDERFDKLQKQLGKLDTETRELLIMRYYSQLGFKEIAEIRAEPIGTTLSKVHRAIKKLREFME